MTYIAFSTVLALPPREQRRLLQEGDPPERLWAAWALALAVGADAVPVVEQAALLEGNDGLRCQLLVLAAGLGERALLATVGTHDRSPNVRGTACAYFLRTAPSATDAEALAFARDRLCDDEAVVREAILLEHEGGRFVLPASMLLPLLHDGSFEVRGLALRCLVGEGGPSESAIDAMLDALVGEPDKDLARQMFLWIPRSRYPALFGALGTAPASTIEPFLRLAKECHDTLDWADLAPLSGSTEPLVSIGMLRLLGGRLPEGALRWVARWYVLLSAGDRTATGRWLTFRLLQDNLSTETVKLLDDASAARLKRDLEEEAEYLEREAEYLEDEAEYLEDEAESGADPSDWDVTESLRQVRESLALLAARERRP